MGLGWGSLILIAIVALIIFGPKKLPELARAFGHSLREFKSATRGLADDDDDERQHHSESRRSDDRD